jgi:hypothetical protein
MGTRRTAWHLFFAILLRKRGSPAFHVHDEVPLSEEAPRMDYLLLQREDGPAMGETLRGLWPRLPRAAIAELKSLGRPYRAGELDRLFGYTHLYYADVHANLPEREELAAVLFVPARSPTLVNDVAQMGLVWVDLGGGYWRLPGSLFPTYAVELAVVADSEDDDVLRLFGHGYATTLEGKRFWAEQVGTREAGMATSELEEFDEVIQRFLRSLTPEQRIAGLDPEQRLAGLAPEQRLAGLDPEQLVLALPDRLLRGLSDEYLATLTPATREVIRKRIGR